MAPVAIQAVLVSTNNDNNNNKDEGQQFSDDGLAIENTSDNNTEIKHHADNNDDTNYDDPFDFFDVDNASFWDVVASFSMLLLWFQRCTFGVSNLIRSLVLGHCLRLLFRSTLVTSSNNNHHHNDHHHHHHHHASPSEERNHDSIIGVQKYFYLMQSLLFGNGEATSIINSNTAVPHGHKHVNGAWPPPALVALAILTIVALVVHPDGLTWILLRKIRDALMSLLHSSTTCWGLMIRDYGVVGTVSASASIALVLLLAVAMHKAFLSNCCSGSGGNKDRNGASASKRRSAANESKKRRRRKGHRGRIKGGSSNGGPTSSTSPTIHSPRLPKVEEVSSDGTTSRNGSSNELHKMMYDDAHSSKASSVKTQNRESHQSVNLSCFVPSHHEEEGGSIMTSPSALESVVSSEEYENKGRTPVPSVCTVDTTSMSDDISCGSFSVRSVPPPVRQTNTRGNAQKGGKTNTTRGGAKANNKSKKQPKVPAKVAPAMPSKARADELMKTSQKSASKATLPAMGASNRFDALKKQRTNAAKVAGTNKGRVTVPSQNPRSGRGKAEQPPKTQKSWNVARTASPLPTTTMTTTGNKGAVSLASPKPANIPLIVTDSPVADLKNSPTDDRLPPFSPYSQSLFSCEVGASGWSLPALPIVAEPPTTAKPLKSFGSSPAPALSYSTNPFVAPYSQLPMESNNSGRTTPVMLQEPGSSLGLWNSVQASTPSAATIVSNSSDLTMTTTPGRPLRPPPGLPPPPGLAPPGLSSGQHTNPLLRTPEQPSFIPVTPTLGSPNHQISSPLSAWSNNLGCLDGGLPTPRSSTTSTTSRHSIVKENPFAVDDNGSALPDEAECRIEAELQELGGRMIGSVLD